MDDMAGKEKITIHGQYDMSTTVEHDQTNTVNNDFTETIKKNATVSITEPSDAVAVRIDAPTDLGADRPNRLRACVTGGRGRREDGRRAKCP